jgi:hypothetical protein
VADTVEIPLLDERQLSSRDSGNGGKVAFDDRGNAVWQYAPSTEVVLDGDVLPANSLEHPGLAIVDDDPVAQSPAIRTNKLGLRVGYNPYDSGQLSGKTTRRPRDMRELSRWIELRKKLAATDK